MLTAALTSSCHNKDVPNSVSFGLKNGIIDRWTWVINIFQLHELAVFCRTACSHVKCLILQLVQLGAVMLNSDLRPLCHYAHNIQTNKDWFPFHLCVRVKYQIMSHVAVIVWEEATLWTVSCLEQWLLLIFICYPVLPALSESQRNFVDLKLSILSLFVSRWFGLKSV